VAASGPLKGMLDIDSAAETPFKAIMSKGVSLSLDRVVTIT